MEPTVEIHKVRIDKWLWAARFFKTRSKAKEAVVGGKVHVNGERVKPARSIREGDALTITLARDRVGVVVKGVSDQRGSATMAQTLYEETSESKDRRIEQSEKQKVVQIGRSTRRGKPNREDRRRLAQLKQKGWAS
ncbi:MAG: S4 domain-containing protein [Gammaproteobacteria bacterium]|nr:S4 domain-containing protein [Gammaproteobacteria bacterium]